MAVMNKGLQIYKLKKELKKHGIDPDLVDLDALVDSKLTYKENKKNIFKLLGIGKKGKKLDEDEILDALRQALMYHTEFRSDRARIIDDAKVAKLPKKVQSWFKHPERYDLPGIDAPGTYRDYIKYLENLNKKKKKKKRKKKKEQSNKRASKSK